MTTLRDIIYIEDIAKQLDEWEGKTVTLRGWLYNQRSSGKLHFLQLRDGTGILQCVVFAKDVSEELFAQADHVQQETALAVTGEVRRDKRSPIGFELGVKGLEVVAGSPEVVSHWRDAGYAVQVVTGRPPSTIESTRRWLGRFSIHHDALLSVDKYNRHNNAPGSISLKQLASARFALAIEDSAPMAHFLVEHTGARVALMDRPWNRHPAAASHPRITRVYTWPQIHRLSLELGVGSSPGGS